ncbi:MAG: AAA family ATPase, partial [Clostridia bacterium]
MEIDPANALIVLDEIQEVPAVLQSLNYFTENEQQSYTILAGDSLLGIALHQGTSYPVGKVDTMNLYPLSFP